MGTPVECRLANVKFNLFLFTRFYFIVLTYLSFLIFFYFSFFFIGGRLLCIQFDLLERSRDNTCIQIGKIIQRLVQVCVDGPLSSSGSGKRFKKSSVARELEVSNMFEETCKFGYVSDLQCLCEWIISW